MSSATLTPLTRRTGVRPPDDRAPRSRRPRAAALALATALALPTASPTALAALDEGERARAEALARTVPWSAPRAGDREVEGGRAAAGALGVQTLAVEEEPRKGAPPGARLVRVYQHDHGTFGTRRVVVDLATARVLEARPLASPHLPLAEPERRWALARLAADDALLEALRDEQRRRGEPAFASLDELDVKASVFEPTDPRHVCARERCALLSLFDRSRTVFAAEPLVRFADGTVRPLDDARWSR